MRMAQFLTALVTLVFGQSTDAAEADGRAQYYSGAEWVLDSDGHVIASSTILLERQLDIPNRELRQSVLRETPSGGALAASSTSTIMLLATSSSPFALEGVAQRDGARVDVVEQITKNVLVIRETIRREDGRIEMHVLNATPLHREEYAPWAQRLAAR